MKKEPKPRLRNPAIILTRRFSHIWLEKFFKGFFMIQAILTSLIVVLLLVILFTQSQAFFQKISWIDFFTGSEWKPFSRSDQKFGALPLILGTLQIAVGAGLFALPLGMLIAIFLAQYCNKRSREFWLSTIEIFAGVPSVVYGTFAVLTITPLLRLVLPEIEVFNALAGSLAVGISVLPMVSSIIFNAILSLPKTMIRGGYALGMHHFQIIYHIILPGVFSSIVAAFLLAFSRAIGETMAVTLAAGATPKMGFDYLASIQTITAYIVQVSLGDVSFASIEYYTIFALGLTLFCFTFIFNVISQLILQRQQSHYQYL